MLQIGTCTAVPGTVTKGVLPFGELSDGTPCSIPVLVVTGAAPGPVLWLSAAVHGTEVIGIEVIRRVIREEVDPASLAGTIIAVPIANPLAYRAATYVTPEDYGNPHHGMPGNPNGTLTQRLANALAREGLDKADVVIDIHTNPAPYLSFSALSRVPGATQATYENSAELARVFGLTTVERKVSAAWSRHMAEYVQASGKPCVAVHLEGYHRFDEACVRAGVRGCLNVMSRLGMISREIAPQSGLTILDRPVYRDDRCDLRATRGGLLHAAWQPGDPIREGDVVARVYDAWGDLVEELRSPLDGVFLGLRPGRNQAVFSGDVAVAIGLFEPPA